jgi:hydroxypyruvate reductase
MSKPLVLANAPLSPWLTRGLDDRFDLVAMAEAGARAQQAEVVVTTGIHGLASSTIDALPALRLVAVHGVGYDKVDVEHARARGISVTNTPDVLTDDVADMAIGLVLATARRVAEGDRYVRAGLWGMAPGPPLGRKVTGKRFGILGLGRIGAAIARRLEPFSDHIAYHNRRPVEGCAYRYIDSLMELARASDILVVATSGGPATEKMVDAHILDALGPDGMLINIGRGTTVDEEALIDALESGRIVGAGLDVFAGEPDVPERLRRLDQVVLQPHQASATIETRIAMAELVLANVAAHFEGKGLVTPV